MKRHELDVTSLLAGLVFAGLAIAFLLAGADLVDMRWVWPALFLGLGATGLAAALRPDGQNTGDGPGDDEPDG